MTKQTKLAIPVIQNSFYVLLCYRKCKTKASFLLGSCPIFPKQLKEAEMKKPKGPLFFPCNMPASYRVRLGSQGRLSKNFG